MALADKVTTKTTDMEAGSAFFYGEPSKSYTSWTDVLYQFGDEMR